MRPTDTSLAMRLLKPMARIAVAAFPGLQGQVSRVCSATIWMRTRIAPPELLPKTGPLPHLICSRQSNLGSGDEEGEHGDTSGVDFGDQGALRLGRAAGKGKD